METLLLDVRHACGMMRRNMAFTTAGLVNARAGHRRHDAGVSVVYVCACSAQPC